MVDAIRTVEKAVGQVHYGPGTQEIASRQYRRSLFVTKAMRSGEIFSPQNVRSIRPANGLHPRHQPDVLGRRAARDIEAGEPLLWDLVEQTETVVASPRPRAKSEGGSLRA